MPVELTDPPGVVTVRATAPVPGGDVTVIEPVVFAVMAAEVVPKVTEAAADKFVPVIVTLVPPAVGPLVGVNPVIVGAGGI